jgi:1,4-dihydroxy-6-naphthoate synthase
LARARTLTIACTPDSDDAFYYFGLETGRVCLMYARLEFHREPMSVLNRAALDGHYDVTAISSVHYPQVAEQYAVLSVGTSVGRGYGPVLVSKEPCEVGDLRGRRVGVPGIPTTGWFLLRRLCPEAVTVEMPFDRIGEAVAAGEIDAGVMIHEELLYYPRLGLCPVADLGAEWCREHGLPLPVGLNVIRRALGEGTMQAVCAAIRLSLRVAQRRKDEALARVSRFGRGAEGQCTAPFVEMFANADSVRMPADVRRALGVLLAQVAAMGAGPALPRIDIVEGTSRRAAGLAPAVFTAGMNPAAR